MCFKKTYTLQELIDRKLLHKKALTYTRYCQVFYEFRKSNTYRESVLLTAVKFDTSESTVERAIRAFKQDFLTSDS